VFVLSTTPREGFGIVLFEAMAAGLPIIASAVDPVREVLADGRWGTLVEVGNAEALAAALAAAAGPDHHGSAAERRAYATAFTPERMIRDYLKEAHLGATAADDAPVLPLPVDSVRPRETRAAGDAGQPFLTRS
jgi:glycosyltransferase involved in cell wall biosynthesis